MSDPYLGTAEAYAQIKNAALSAAEDNVKATAIAAKNAVEAATKARVESSLANVALKGVKAAVEVDAAPAAKVTHIVAATALALVVIAVIGAVVAHYVLGWL